MALLICIGCGHPADEHHESGCIEIVGEAHDGYPAFCDCPRTPHAIYAEQWPRPGMASDREG